MSTNVQDSEALSGFKPPTGFLRMKIEVAGEKGGQGKLYKHTIVPFPETYAAAQILAFQALGQWIDKSVGLDPGDISFEGIARDRDGEWTTFEIIADHWRTVVPECFSEVLVHSPVTPNSKVKTDVDEPDFLGGNLWLTVGKEESGYIRWTRVVRGVYNDPGKYGREAPGQPVTPWIQRPRSYEHALSLVIDAVKADPKLLATLFPNVSPIAFGNRIDTPSIPPDGAQFYIFPVKDSTGMWKTFPTDSYTNEKKWRDVVPMPDEIIGMTLRQSAT